VAFPLKIDPGQLLSSSPAHEILPGNPFFANMVFVVSVHDFDIIDRDKI
jgi:hypothetical protein